MIALDCTHQDGAKSGTIFRQGRSTRPRSMVMAETGT
jgi:hypothetical protein